MDGWLQKTFNIPLCSNKSFGSTSPTPLLVCVSFPKVRKFHCKFPWKQTKWLAGKSTFSRGNTSTHSWFWEKIVQPVIPEELLGPNTWPICGFQLRYRWVHWGLSLKKTPALLPWFFRAKDGTLHVMVDLNQNKWASKEYILYVYWILCISNKYTYCVLPNDDLVVEVVNSIHVHLKQLQNTYSNQYVMGKNGIPGVPCWMKISL